LTIDVQLPLPTAELAENVKERTFWLPVVSLTKTPPRSNIDFHDEQDRDLPLLNRDENAKISAAAVIQAAEDLLPNPPSDLLRALLREVVLREGIEADISLAVVQKALIEEQGPADSTAGRAFDEALRTLAGNSWLWLPIRGRPGDRRIIKFRYDFSLAPEKLRRRRPGTRLFLLQAEESGVLYRLDLKDLGDGNPRSFVRRLMARLANATGLAAIDLFVDSPYIRGSQTYHMQVDSPPAVEARGIRLLARLGPGEAVVDERHREHGAHLYLANAQVEEMLPTVVTLRVGRRGFLTLSWLTSLLIAGLLWAFHEQWAAAALEPEATVAALLIIPALLTAFVLRPGEHPLASRLLFGVRILVGLGGLLAVAAALAAIGVRPTDWDLRQAWLIYAIAATVVAGWLSLSWVLAWDTTHRLAEWARGGWSTRWIYSVSVASALTLAVVLVVAGLLWADLPDGWKIGAAAGAAALALFLGFAFATYARIDLPRAAGWIAAAAFFGALLCGWAAAELVMNLSANWGWARPWDLVLAGLLICLAILGGQEAYLACRRRTGNPKDAPV
jgi:hypothetical protein